MESYIINHTISLGYITEVDTGYDKFQLNIIKSESIVTPQFLSLPKEVQIISSFLYLTNAAIFTYFRFIVYKYLFKQFKMKEVTVVNILTMITCLVQHLEIFWGVMNKLIMLWVGNGYSDLVMPWLCPINSKIGPIMWGYSVLGGLGIATYRILLIKHPVLVKDIIGRKRLMCIILFTELFILAFLVASVPMTNTYWDPVRPPCMYMVPGNILQFIDTYRQSIGMLPFLSYHRMHRIFIFSAYLAFTLSEIIVYVIFFHHIYKHDNNGRLRQLLGHEAIHARNKKNAMSFISLFFSFLVESFMIIFGCICRIFGTKENFLFIAPLFLRKFSFTAMAIVEVVTSSTLRQIMCKPKHN